MNKVNRLDNILILVIIAGTLLSAFTGIITSSKSDQFKYTSIRGQDVIIHGKGIYRHMSHEVAIQGIAQDYISLIVAVPLLLICLLNRKKSSNLLIMLAGTSFYLFVSNLFYLCMCMYNEIFLLYVVLLGSTFFLFLRTILKLSTEKLEAFYTATKARKFSGAFLMINSILITFMWLGVIIPPLLEGTLYPIALEHYTTLIVQGLDLGLLLPMSFISGMLFYKNSRYGYLFAPVYLVFLSILMTALTAKITAMGLSGYNIIPAIFIIPAINLISVITTIVLLRYSSNK